MRWRRSRIVRDGCGSYTLYVPNNFTPAHSRDAHRIPVLYPLHEPCIYLWPNLPPATAEILKPLVAELSYLGRADSQVVAEVLDDPPPPNFVPDDDGGLFLRTPHAGRLEQLRAAYESGLASFACRARTGGVRAVAHSREARRGGAFALADGCADGGTGGGGRD